MWTSTAPAWPLSLPIVLLVGVAPGACVYLINNLGQVLVIVALAALAVVGVEILRRQAAREFPQRNSS